MRKAKFPAKLHVLISNNNYNAIDIRHRPENLHVFNEIIGVENIIIDILIIDMI
ncbi:hypothetical protein TSL6_11700 [Sulfurovum sp. TSL6]|uniref:hypothetical protein n=1 Tax=Sulfurovum sp. TSL6 TaxID=2826995 RepID=UPI001CC732FC|nr:hypothetical protein [Sulfurovum sp. TSL6]GIU00664.1 hypothetical protein TSL6_11700 [Sulfurovum sp. TSL6]